MPTQHTPTPWFFQQAVTEPRYFIARKTDVSPSGMEGIAGLYKGGDEEAKANAAFIILACNAHDLLLAAAKEGLAWIDKNTKGIAIDSKDLLRLAIAKSEGK